jgi:TolB-like protein
MAHHAAILALLPIENLTDVPENDRLAKGFAQDLLTELARFPTLGVIAAESVRAARASSDSDSDLAARVGANFVVKGSVRAFDESLRWNFQLVEAESGRHFWAGRYDESSLSQAQDEIAAKIANALAIRVDHERLAASRRRQTTSLEAYECWLRGMECVQRGTLEGDDEGRLFFEQAAGVDPHYARAYAGISLSHFNEWSCQTWRMWDEKEKLAYEFAAKAADIDPNDPMVQLILARIEQYRREFDRAARRIERIRLLAPNDATILIHLASCETFDGDAERGQTSAIRALELNPLCPDWCYIYAAVPLFVLRKYEESLETCSRASLESVIDAPAYRAAAAAYLGRRDEARDHLSEFRRDFTNRIAGGRETTLEELLRWVLHVNPYRRAEDVRHLEEGLRLAGLDEQPQSAAKKSSNAPLNWPIGNVFRREGAVWTICFEHEVIQLPDARGLNDLARLLGTPGHEIASSELAESGLHAEGLPAIDDRALKVYKQRLAEIDAELEENPDNEDRATELDEERERIIAEIRRSTGLGGRGRSTGGAAERARTAVTWRIRHAIKKIEAEHPNLGRHLRHSIRTGSFCSYQPEKPVEWYT